VSDGRRQGRQQEGRGVSFRSLCLSVSLSIAHLDWRGEGVTDGEGGIAALYSGGMGKRPRPQDSKSRMVKGGGWGRPYPCFLFFSLRFSPCLVSLVASAQTCERGGRGGRRGRDGSSPLCMCMCR
jgi:hypothetical protein